jgi:hypothetical protein
VVPARYPESFVRDLFMYDIHTNAGKLADFERHGTGSFR